MRILLILLPLMTICLSPATAAPSQKCTTTLRIYTCGQRAVEDHKVKIEIRDGEKVKEKTDAEGKIVLEVCQEEISEVKVSGVASSKISKTTVLDSTDTEILATITLNICGA